ncbi:glycosyltransferase family 2 protein [Paraburkholderia phosphatilytica]|uniref:glycosyltransferase family 2 protein n=1 Tax=Paraburkholderia phosphatilytica TaxID=2282883 RepID=UPI000E512BDC|nr:glycosyltransferase [Paraburkholderia phosphatilytica]
MVSGRDEGTNPVLSVVVMCYNHEDFIGECLQSIVTQELDVPFEIIVGDDGSKDQSVAIVEAYQGHYPGLVRLVRHPANIGYSRNLADLIAAVRGDFIAYIDGDDLMLPGKLTRQLALLRAQPELGMVVHKMRTVDWRSKEPVDFPLARAKPAVFDAEYLIEHGPFFFGSSAMFRSDLRRRYPVDTTLKIVADVANLTQSLYGSKARYLDEEYGLYRVNPKGFTSTIIKNPAKHETHVSDMMHTYVIAEALGMDKALVDRARATLYLRSAIMFLEAGDYAEFRRYIQTSMRYSRIGAKQAWLHAMHRQPAVLRSLYALAKQLANRARATHRATHPPGAAGSLQPLQRE